MAKSDVYVRRTEEFLEILKDKKDFEVVDVEFVKEGTEYFLRVYCDVEGGIDIDDCVEISHYISDWLDEEDFISENYTLEVSSPGLGRTLKKDRDFIRENGKKVEVKLFKALDKQKDFEGFLKGFDNDTITIEDDGNEITFDRKNIAVIRLAVDF
jgi:ribosome maturation factor rimP